MPGVFRLPGRDFICLNKFTKPIRRCLWPAYPDQLVSGQRALDNFHGRLRLFEFSREIRAQVFIRLARNRWCGDADFHTAVVNIPYLIAFGPGLDMNVDQQILAGPVIPLPGCHAQIE